jgi:Tol biopolymer transport system component
VICDPASNNFDPAWSPDGNSLAFVSNRDVAWENQIYVSDLSGAVQTRLTNSSGPPGGNLFFNWSPSGQRIAFASNRDGNYEIYSMRSDGTDVKRLTQDPAYDIHPAWSPDGVKIAFTSSRNDPNPSTCNPCNLDI